MVILPQVNTLQHKPRSVTLFWLSASVMAWFVVCTLIFCVGSRHWPLVNDAALMHYVAFLMDHGVRPYRDILDPNMPGSYLLEWIVIHRFGAGAAGARVYDLLLLALAAGAMLAIGWRRSRLAALCAGCLFALFHGRDGMAQLGQRDLALAVMLLMAIALALRLARQPALLTAFAFGLTSSSALTIKPYALLFLLLLLPVQAYIVENRRLQLLGAGALGMLLPLAGLAFYLVHQGALRPFLFVLLTLDPLHERLGFPGVLYLLKWLVPPSLLLLGLLALVAVRVSPREPENVERALLLTGMIVGVLAYFLQAKGFPYHRYPLVACLILAAALELHRALQRTGLPRLIGAAGLLTALVLAPLYVVHGLRSRWPNEMELSLERDLIQNGGGALNGSVQCIDSIEGCTRVLYDMHLVQSTGVLYDEFLFLRDPSPLLALRREQFLASVEAAPPRIFVITPGLFPAGPAAYGKLLLWPAFNSYLAHCYDETEDRTFAHGAPTEPGYRMYKLASRCHS